jgi:transposase
MRQIQHLYRVEARLREQRAGPRLREAVRAHQSRPIVQRLQRAFLRLKSGGKHLPQSLLGIALDYALGQWKTLEVYLADGRVEIDNNLVENAIRPTALGKNYVEVIIMRRCDGCFADARASWWLDKESTAHN